MLNVEALQIFFQTNEDNGKALGPISFISSPGTFIGITGKSGSGKTSLLMALGGLLNEHAPLLKHTGSVYLFGNKLSQDFFLPEVSLVIENPYSQCTGMKATFLEEMVFPLEARGFSRHEMSSAIKFFSSIFETKNLLESDINWLSGGELQRLNLCSGLIFKPRLLLLDQVFTELDASLRSRLIRFLKFYAEVNQSVVIVTLSTGEIPYHHFDLLINLSGDSGKHSSQNQEDSYISEINDTTSPVLEIRNLSFKYSNFSPELFRGLSFSLLKGQIALLLGPNGSGKSTLAKLLIGVLPCPKDAILILGKPVSKLKFSGTPILASIAFQNPDHYFSKGKVCEELYYPGHLKNSPSWYEELINILGIKGFAEKNPFDLPRGERKRLSIIVAARAAPKILFLDEPTQYQDEEGVESIKSAILFLSKCGIAVICCTHDLRLIEKLKGSKKILIPSPMPLSISKKTELFPYYKLPEPPNVSESDLREWIVKYWEANQEEWLQAMPDIYSYWDSTVYPFLDRTIQSMTIPRSMKYLDIGCGYGWQTIKMKNLLEQNGFFCEGVLGLDIQENMIECANFFFHDIAKIKFFQCDVTDVENMDKLLKETLSSRADVATSFFVLHDEPNCIAIIKNAYLSLKEGGYFLSVILNPKWVKFLKDNLLMDYITREKFTFSQKETRNFWSWMGMYPLVREKKEPLKLPYFHRSISEYISIMEETGFIISEPIDLKINESQTLEFQKIFGQGKMVQANELGIIASSILIVGQKKKMAL